MMFLSLNKQGPCYSRNKINLFLLLLLYTISFPGFCEENPVKKFVDSSIDQKLKYSAGCTSKLHDGILSQTLSGDRPIDGVVCFEPVTLEKNKKYEFHCDMEASKISIAYLQAKLYRNGKEIKRINSRVNNQLNESLSLQVTPGNGETLELLCRIPRRKKNMGKTVYWKNFYFSYEGRINRKKLWLNFAAPAFLVGLVLAMIDASFGWAFGLSTIFAIAILWPKVVLATIH